MNAQAGSTSRLRLGLQVSGLVAAASLGFLLAAHPPTAAADGLLPTTVAIPPLPISVPTVTLPGVTTTTVTTPVLTTTIGTTPIGTTTTTPTTTVTTPTTSGSTTAGTAAPAAGAASGIAAATAGATAAGTSGATGATSALGTTVTALSVAGALRLSGGSISIPVKSVVAPNGLRLLVTLAPRVVDAKRTLTATGRVRDARGYLVRGATVTLRSIPGGLLTPVAHKRSAADGRAGFVVRAKASALTGKRLWLLVGATDPTRPKTVSVSRAIAVPIAAGSR
jgi:hypothetical protein